MGDVVHVKGDLLYVVGRTKVSDHSDPLSPHLGAPPQDFNPRAVQEIFKYHGLQVAPAELEALLCEHEAVADAAVVGVPGEDTEVPRALVVLRPGVQLGAVSAEDIAVWIEARVADHKRLRGGVAFVPEVPRLLSGKIARARLKELALGDDLSD